MLEKVGVEGESCEMLGKVVGVLESVGSKYPAPKERGSMIDQWVLTIGNIQMV